MLVGIPRSDGWRDDGERGGFSARTRYAMSPDSRFLFLAYGGKIHRIDIESGKDEILPFRARVNQCLDPLNRFQFERSEERRVGTRCAIRCRAGGPLYHKKKKKNNKK